MKKYNYETTENFIKKSKITHGDKYDYSNSNYINAITTVKIICPIHGEFEQIPRNHIRGQNCQKCSGVYMDKNYFIEKSKSLHGDKYDYSLVNYRTQLTKIQIICPTHGIFEQRPKDHLSGKSCSKCSGKNKTTDDLIKEFNEINNHQYNYSKVIYKDAKTKVKIICDKHGEFEQTPNAHLRGHGCPICRESKGEKEIRNYLTNKKISFIPQHKFYDCKNLKELPFDFYLPDYNTCVEFNGEQHFKPIKYFGGVDKFKKLQINDLIKFNYCKTNKINLIIINEIKNIKSLLTFP
jgi:hypothetical protein